MTAEDLEALVAANADLFDPKWQGIEFGPGWTDLFTEMLDRCRRDRAPVIIRTKEKLGTLRVYFADQAHPVARSIREEAMRRSADTCEICGSPGSPSHPGPGFLATRCQDHLTE